MILRSADIINGYYMQVMLFAGVNVMMTASLNLVNGFTGQFCIGHAGFMSLGAYGSAVITTLVFKGTSVAPAAQIPVFLLGLLCGGIVAALVGCDRHPVPEAQRATIWPSSRWPSARSSAPCSVSSNRSAAHAA